VPADCPPGVADLVDACLSQKASARPSAADIAALLEGDPKVLEAPRAKVYDPEEHSDVSFATQEELSRLLSISNQQCQDECPQGPLHMPLGYAWQGR
jgi:hypothetical protein